MASTRELIMANLLSVVQAISGPPTYANNLSSDNVITREPLEITELHRSSFPAAILGEGAQDVASHFDTGDGIILSQSQSTFRVNILALVAQVVGVNTKLNAWLADILKAVMKDITRGGVAFDTQLESIGPPDENTIIPDGLAAVQMVFAVRYLHSADTL